MLFRCLCSATCSTSMLGSVVLQTGRGPLLLAEMYPVCNTLQSLSVPYFLLQTCGPSPCTGYCNLKAACAYSTPRTEQGFGHSRWTFPPAPPRSPSTPDAGLWLNRTSLFFSSVCFGGGGTARLVEYQLSMQEAPGSILRTT